MKKIKNLYTIQTHFLVHNGRYFKLYFMCLLLSTEYSILLIYFCSFFEVKHGEEYKNEISNTGISNENVIIKNKDLQYNSDTICKTDFMN